jgi:hypothetical protein
MTKIFKIVATWEVSGEYDIEADEQTNLHNPDGHPYQIIH